MLLHASVETAVRLIRPTLLSVTLAPPPPDPDPAGGGGGGGGGGAVMEAVGLDTLSLLPDKVRARARARAS